MTDALPARAADIGNTVRYILSGHIPSWEAIRDLVLPELRKVRQEALEEAAKIAESRASRRSAIDRSETGWMQEAREIAQNIRGLMEADDARKD